MRALDANETLLIRSPNAIRPWQHVLEPLAGYLMLAEKLVTDGANYAEAWNFGPEEADAKPVSWIVEYLCNKIPSAKWELEDTPQPHEEGLLKLDSSRQRISFSGLRAGLWIWPWIKPPIGTKVGGKVRQWINYPLSK